LEAVVQKTCIAMSSSGLLLPSTTSHIRHIL